jgi:DNA invertase Pin-like site-specific DNA recombinase
MTRTEPTDRPSRAHERRRRLNLIAYLRVSTDRQAEHGLGLEIQEAAIRVWAKQNGHRIVLWASDEGVSGSNGLETRTALPEALGAVQDGTAGGLVVYRLDRLARDLVLQEQLLAEVRRLGGEVFTTSAAEAGYLADDPNDPSRKLIRQILGAVNEYERSVIKLRLRSGRARKNHNGGYAYGSPPLGYRAEGRQLVADNDEQRVVKRIRALRAQGRSLRQIADTLTAEGFKPKRSATWHPESLRRIVGRLERAR